MTKKLVTWMKKGIAATALCAFMIGSASSVLTNAGSDAVNDAASYNKTKESASLRFVFTTDLHGMISSMNYESGMDFKNSGLSRAYDLIQQARKELPENNVYTFDIGDVLFDATTEYIIEHDSEVVQPIYQAMSLVGYDAITLGNHDFDYGKDYLMHQLYGSGMFPKVVLSNLMNSKDNTYPFARNMIITREIETYQGNKMEISIGVIGETIPKLSAKTQDYTGVWKTEDIVFNTAKEAALLKSQGADFIVVLAHSGFGDEYPEENAENAVYALSKLDDVDVILCGHEHNEFPSDDSSLYYYSLPGVDKETSLVNNKAVVMAKNLGRSIGVVDVNISMDEQSNLKVEHYKGEVRRVTASNTKESTEILKSFDLWREEFETYRIKELAVLEENEVIENYFGLLSDNKSLQLQNEAKISYALRYLMRYKPDYAKYPILAASTYTSYGANGSDDFVNITGSISQGDLAPIQNYRQYTSIYRITGRQLREWLEWSASAYRTLGSKERLSSDYVNGLMDKTKLSTLLADGWLTDWSNFYLFDGIEYTIDPAKSPRYDINGKKISNNYRITELIYNGKPIQDTDEFVIAAPTLSTSFAPFSFVTTQTIYKQYKTQYLMAEYLEMLGKSGKVTVPVNQNWSILLPDHYEFIVKASTAGDKLAQKSAWYSETLDGYAGYFYYRAKYMEIQNKTQASIVISPFTTEPSSGSFDVYVEATAPAGVKKVCYYPGFMDINDASWNYMREVTDKKFTAYMNGTYSVFVEDNQGNRTIRTFVIDNIGVKNMNPPKVKSVNNLSTTIRGTAEVGATIVLETTKKTYQVKVKTDGTFSCSVSALDYGETIYAYAMEEENNRKSDTVKISVRKAAPNQPAVSEYYNNSQSLFGSTRDEDAFPVVYVDELRRVYVASEDEKDILENSNGFDQTFYQIVVVDGQKNSDGSFSLALPEMELNTLLMIYNLDHVGRQSRGVSMKVLDGGPRRPSVNTVYHIEKSISGFVSSSAGKYKFSVFAIVNGKIYQGESDTSGNFLISFEEQLKPGDIIYVYAKDEVKQKVRTSATTVAVVQDFNTMQSSGTITLEQLNENTNKITVNYKPNREIYISYPKGEGNATVLVKTNSKGNYTVLTNESLTSGTNIYAYTRYPYGGVIDVASAMVPYKIPETPYFVNELSNINKKVKLVSDKDSKVYLSIGKVTYVSDEGVYNKSLQGYVHTFSIAKAPAGTKVFFYAKNPSNQSDVAESEVAKVGADIRTYGGITVGSKKIYGTIDIFTKEMVEQDKQRKAIMDTEAEATINDETKQSSKNTPEKATQQNKEKEEKMITTTVKGSGSSVKVKINSKTYKAKLYEDGRFEAAIPALKAGDTIAVWAKNKGGIGVSIALTLVE